MTLAEIFRAVKWAEIQAVLVCAYPEHLSCLGQFEQADLTVDGVRRLHRGICARDAEALRVEAHGGIMVTRPVFICKPQDLRTSPRRIAPPRRPGRAS